jgi:hypothetical protein
VFDRYLSGWTIAGAVQRAELEAIDERGRRKLECAVLDLLAGDHESSAMERIGG